METKENVQHEAAEDKEGQVVIYTTIPCLHKILLLPEAPFQGGTLTNINEEV